MDDRTQIHRDNVCRLIYLLRSPKHCPVLNPEKRERIIESVALDETEILRVRAAILATSLEKMLMDRVSQFDALLASDGVASTASQIGTPSGHSASTLRTHRDCGVAPVIFPSASAAETPGHCRSHEGEWERSGIERLLLLGFSSLKPSSIRPCSATENCLSLLLSKHQQ